VISRVVQIYITFHYAVPIDQKANAMFCEKKNSNHPVQEKAFFAP
jgi:hypothetical protein